jgi:nicotinate-nucleotide adenylyltransferase
LGLSAAPPQASAPRIGVFGGAFDPPHRAHLALAQAAVQQLGLDSLLVVPTGLAWHKPRTLTDASHRIAMCQLAFAQVPKAKVDNRETRRTGPSYTADTLAEIQSEHPTASLYLLIGQDQARALPTWHRWAEVAGAATICVALRPGSMPAGAAPTQSTHSARSPDLESLAIPGLVQINMTPMDLSATDVRRQAGRLQELAAWVSDPVARYIEQHHLYQADR